MKFLVGFFYFSGWQEIHKELQKNEDVKLKILVGLQVDKYLSGIVEVENKDDSLSGFGILDLKHILIFSFFH